MSDAHPVFVTGATGVLGSALVRSLLGAGHSVRALVRRSEAALPAGVEAVVGDLDAADALRQGLDGASAAVHLAAQLHINNPSPALADLYRRVNTEGTERLCRLATEAGVEQVVFTSTINVYGPSAGRPPWTEADAPTPQTLYARTKLDAEAAVLDLPAGVVYRLGAVYGPGMKGNYPSLARLLRRGVRVLPGDGTNRRTLVHLGDAVQALAQAASGAVPAGVYNLTDGRVHTFDAILRGIQRAVGRRPGVRYVPAGVVRPLLAVPEGLARLAGRRVPARALLDKLTEDVAVDGTALIAASPYRPRYVDLDVGWAASDLASS
ncbi:MAG: NAD-dependent epimerase/dehydratase family protein [Bacteroidota bacterium]